MLKKIFTVAVLATLFSCASIMQGTTQKVSFASTPANARILIDGKEKGSTPTSLELSRDAEHTVLLELDGFAPYEIQMKQSTSGWFWGNILLGGLIGIIVDASNGAMYNLTPEQIDVELKESSMAFKKSGDNIYFAVTLKAKKDWKKIATLEKVAK